MVQVAAAKSVSNSCSSSTCPTCGPTSACGPTARSEHASRATDLVQSVCRELLQGSSHFQFQGDAAFRKWLCTAALRKIVERDRAMHRQKRDVDREEHAATDSRQGALLDAYATVSTPSVVLSRKENIAALRSRVRPPARRVSRVITLAKIVGLSHAEIAAQMERTEAATRQLFAARADPARDAARRRGRRRRRRRRRLRFFREVGVTRRGRLPIGLVNQHPRHQP